MSFLRTYVWLLMACGVEASTPSIEPTGSTRSTGTARATQVQYPDPAVETEGSVDSESVEAFLACVQSPSPPECAWRFPMVSTDRRRVAIAFSLEDGGRGNENWHVAILTVGRVEVARQFVVIAGRDDFLGFDETPPDTLAIIRERFRAVRDTLSDFEPLALQTALRSSMEDMDQADEGIELELDDRAQLREDSGPVSGVVRAGDEVVFRGAIPTRTYVMMGSDGPCDSAGARSVSAAFAPDHDIVLFDLRYDSWGDVCSDVTTSIVAVRSEAANSP